jgi:hypothetical protein
MRYVQHKIISLQINEINDEYCFKKVNFDYSILGFYGLDNGRPMQRRKSNFTPEYKIFLATLVGLREESGRTQGDVAKAMCRTQSVVSKCELGLRRMDIVEIHQYCRGIDIAFTRFAEIYEANIASSASTARKRNRTY